MLGKPVMRSNEITIDNLRVLAQNRQISLGIFQRGLQAAQLDFTCPQTLLTLALLKLSDLKFKFDESSQVFFFNTD